MDNRQQGKRARRIRGHPITQNLPLALGLLLASASIAQTLDVPFSTNCTTGIDSECYALHEVRGLDPHADGFLAVRTGPGSGYRMIDRLYNGQKVYVFAARGSWRGILYRDGKRGWSHKNWLYQIAG